MLVVRSSHEEKAVPHPDSYLVSSRPENERSPFDARKVSTPQTMDGLSLLPPALRAKVLRASAEDPGHQGILAQILQREIGRLAGRRQFVVENSLAGHSDLCIQRAPMQPRKANLKRERLPRVLPPRPPKLPAQNRHHQPQTNSLAEPRVEDYEEPDKPRSNLRRSKSPLPTVKRSQQQQQQPPKTVKGKYSTARLERKATTQDRSRLSPSCRFDRPPPAERHQPADSSLAVGIAKPEEVAEKEQVLVKPPPPIKKKRVVRRKPSPPPPPPPAKPTRLAREEPVQMSPKPRPVFVAPDFYTVWIK